MKKITLGLFILILSSSIIIATPPSGNYPIGTSWCENDAHNGDQMYTYEGNGKWSGPYSCPGGCTSVGTGGSCKAPSLGCASAFYGGSCDSESSMETTKLTKLVAID